MIGRKIGLVLTPRVSIFLCWRGPSTFKK